MWILILAMHTSSDLGPKEFPTEQACMGAGHDKRYLGKPVLFVCRRDE